MDEAKAIFFTIGTLAFLVNLYLGIKEPELVGGPMGQEPPADAPEHPLQKFDKAAYWTMWIGWGLTAIVLYLEEADLVDKIL